MMTILKIANKRVERNDFILKQIPKTMIFIYNWLRKRKAKKLITGSLNESSSLVPCCVSHTALRPPALASGAKLHRTSMC